MHQIALQVQDFDEHMAPSHLLSCLQVLANRRRSRFVPPTLRGPQRPHMGPFWAHVVSHVAYWGPRWVQLGPFGPCVGIVPPYYGPMMTQFWARAPKFKVHNTATIQEVASM
jgi:hypothetical protein